MTNLPPDVLRTVVSNALGEHVGPLFLDAAVDDVCAAVAMAAAAHEPARLHRGASKAQRLTADKIIKALPGRRIRALDRVAQHPAGVTCDELVALHGVPHQSLSATLNWLERQGLVERNRDVRRRTRRGGYANPYVITDVGRAAMSRL